MLYKLSLKFTNFKIKGFRVELDGISTSLASAPGVISAATLLIEGQIHGFLNPNNCSLELILEYLHKKQPYYAIPDEFHLLDGLPVTANGKIDKKALQALVTAPPIDEKAQITIESIPKSFSEVSTVLNESRPTTSSTNSILSGSTESPGVELLADIPNKITKQPLRGLRKRIMIAYRVLFSIMTLLNLGALTTLILTRPINNAEWLATLTALNLVIGVLIRQDMVINLLYTIFCFVPKTGPLWIRKRCAKIYHLGGVHSGAGICSTLWLLANTIQATIIRCDTKNEGQGAHQKPSLVFLALSWILSVLCSLLVGCAWPSFRKNHHNFFERFHRFAGWTALILFWIRTGFSVRDSTPSDESVGANLLRSPGFWLLGVATCSIASSWLFLKKVPVHSEVLSNHAIQLSFNYDIPVNGSFTRVSRRPLLEWHSFATIPHPRPPPGPTGPGYSPGYSLVVSNAGDWTKQCIERPPTELWVRGVPTCGVMRIATLFNRVVVIATGSGIGPLLGHINLPSCETQLIWSTPSPEQTFGKDMINKIKKTIPDAVIHDTKILGRPDLVKMGYNMAKGFGAEAVIIIANEKITKKVVYGLETRGIPAYGAIWDS